MQSYVFDNGLSVGNAHIDRQHDDIIYFFERLKRFQPGGSDSEEQLHALISSLIITMTRHFSDEEDLMMRNGCPRFETHVQQHSYFIDRLSQAQQMRGEEILSHGIQSLADIMMQHLIHEDMACRDYLKAVTDTTD